MKEKKLDRYRKELAWLQKKIDGIESNNEQRFGLGDDVFIVGSIKGLVSLVAEFNEGLANLEFSGRISDCFFAIEKTSKALKALEGLAKAAKGDPGKLEKIYQVSAKN